MMAMHTPSARPKNLIIIPLESVSNTILWQYRLEMPTVWRMMRQSLFYSHFYGASVSTGSVLTEVLYGCNDTYDGLSVYEDRSNIKHPWLQHNLGRTTIIRLAQAAGFDYFIAYEDYLNPPGRKGKTRNGESHMWDCDQENLIAAAGERLAKAKAGDTPIVLMFRMVVSHMAFDDQVKIKARTFSERFRLGFARLDYAINRFLSLLEQLGMVDDSIIVFFGDHGDELWSHGLNKGYCHATTPYASLNWTPLFVYDSGRAPGNSARLVSTIDLRESLFKTIIPDCDPTQYLYGAKGKEKPLSPFRRNPSDGIDAFNEERELAFSQNLFALQLEYSDLEKALTKGYSVTDGVYRVVVSSGGHNPKNGGMEFFHDQSDPANTRSLLDFFTLDFNGDIKKFSPPADAVDHGFILAFNERATERLAATYKKLKEALQAYVRDKEQRALQFSSGPCHVMPESVFKHSLKRLFKD